MKRGTPEHPKVYDLCDRLGCDRPTALGHLELLWHFTARYAPQGDIGRFSDKRIEAAVDWNGRGKRAGKFIEAATKSRWCDEVPEHRLVVHDWEDHADDSTRKRLARAGLPFLPVREKVTGQTPDSDRKVSPTQSDNGSLPEPSPDPSPEPEPKPEPTAIDTPRFPQNPREDAGGPALVPPTTENPKPKPGSKPCSDELRQTLNLWRRIEWTDESLSRVTAQLNGLPHKVFCAHLDQMARKFQPGGEAEAHEIGFFVSTARNFAKAYQQAAGNGLSADRFDEMTEVLG